MANKTIIIEKMNADRSLQLSDRGHTKTTKKSFITWKIGNNSGVSAITSLEPKANSVNVFISGDPKPMAGNNSKWQGQIKDFENPATEIYSIGYTDSLGRPHVHDPKISVNTNFGLIAFKKNLLLLALAFLALFSLSVLFTRKNKK